MLDIGTGTGLLSMMAARSGARHVTALEVCVHAEFIVILHGISSISKVFRPMAKLARHIIHDNGLQDTITVVPKRSTEAVVGVDLPAKADVVVMEIFDSELIGEGVLPTMRHAMQVSTRTSAQLLHCRPFVRRRWWQKTVL